jgi:rSAM/selenodomain-associated transferase 1
MSKLKKRAIIYFTRDPNEESAHKRLVGSLEQNLYLWYHIFYRTLNMLYTLQEKFDYDIFITTRHKITNLKNVGNSKRIEKLKQKGRGFENRFYNAFYEVFTRGYDQVVAVGNDCLDLSEDILEEAFYKLSDNDAVLGPSIDGGFYLLGLRKFQGSIFENVDWNTSKVYVQFYLNVCKYYNSIGSLPLLRDIDSQQDLIKWFQQIYKVKEDPIIEIIRVIFNKSKFTNFQTTPFVHKFLTLKRYWQKAPPIKTF